MASKVLIISADCHAGGLPSMYDEYMPARYRDPARRWWIAYAREMLSRSGTFFDQEAVEAYEEGAGHGRGLYGKEAKRGSSVTDDELLRMMCDEKSPFAPRRGEFDAATRVRELDADGVAAEVIFPQMAPFGAGLTQYRHAVARDRNWVGIQAYNRWLADFCATNPGRHAGVALINVDDVDAAVQEIRDAKALGLWGGVLLPTSTGENPYYHHPRYEPLWAVCEELGMPLHSHSGWSPDYGDVQAATAMYISEVAMWAQRPLAALIWSGAFERHPGLRMVFTETGCSWILEALRVLEMHAENPIFKYFSKGLSLTPREYVERQCYIGASFLTPREGENRHRIGLSKLMWGSDYPHLEGTWPNTLAKLRETFASYPEDEIRALLGGNALAVYPFEADVLEAIAEKIGPDLDRIRGEA